MAISLHASGSWARMVSDNGTVAIPGTPAAGDRMFLFGFWKTYSITATPPAGWTPIGTVFADGAVAAGNGTGSVSIMAWYRDWQSGDTAPAIDYSAAPTEAGWVIQVWRKGASDTWDAPATVTGAIPVSDPFTVEASTTVTVPDGSVVMAVAGLRDDSDTFNVAANELDDSGGLVTWSGDVVTSPATHFNSTTGQDMSGTAVHRFVTTGATGVTLRLIDVQISATETGAAKWIVQGTSSSGAYSLTIQGGAYALTGGAISLEHGHKLTSEPGSYALNGSPVLLEHGRRIVPESGPYTLTGSALTLQHDRVLSLEGTAYAMTGGAILLERGYRIGMEATTYALTGSLLNLLFGPAIDIGPGAFALTGSDVNLVYNPTDPTIVIEAASYAINGSPVLLEHGHRIGMEATTYALAGSLLNLLFGPAIDVGPGVYTLTGGDVNLVYNPSDPTIVIEAASYAINGSPVLLKHGHRIVPDSGPYTLTGSPLTLEHDRILPLAGGAFDLSGGDVGLLWDRLLAADVGVYVLTGADVTLDYSGAVIVSPPYRVAAGQVFVAGLAVGETFSPGLAMGETFSPGLAMGETFSPGVASGEVFRPGASAGQARN